ncbi:MAG: hypothetical protein M1587_06760, partial [Thaumarchaeota archaeon]|nr:hypothetical protein [Nitrososphaerota archaeon]
MSSVPNQLKMADAMADLKGATDFNNFYRDNILPLAPSQLLGSAVTATMAEIMKLGSALDLFLAKWVASKNTGSDAIQGELDLELLDTG